MAVKRFRRKKRKGRYKNVKKGMYQGIWCDSSWELAWIIYQTDHGIEFTRNEKKFPYVWRRRKKNWIPDFYCNGTYVEIKGQMTAEVKAKFSHFSLPLVVLFVDDMKPIIEYVVKKHGEKYWMLFD